MKKGSDNVWRLTASSAAIDAASGSYEIISTDIDREKRDAKADVGADEYSTERQYRRPLQQSDVGPQWNYLHVNNSRTQ